MAAYGRVAGAVVRYRAELATMGYGRGQGWDDGKAAGEAKGPGWWRGTRAERVVLLVPIAIGLI